MNYNFGALALLFIALILYVINYRFTKQYISKLSELFGYFAILATVNLIIYVVFVKGNFTLIKLLDVIVGVVRLFMMASVGIFYLSKMNLISMSVSITNSFNKEKLKESIKSGFGISLLLILITLILLFLSSSRVITIDKINSFNLFYFALNSLLQSFAEETVVRLFLQSILTYLFRKISYGYLLAIVLATIVWTIDHNDLSVFGTIRVIQLLSFGIILGLLMRHKGWESCVVAHGIFNTVAYALLGSFTPIA